VLTLLVDFVQPVLHMFPLFVIALLVEPLADLTFFMFQMLAPLVVALFATFVIRHLSANRFGQSGRNRKGCGGEGEKAELASEHGGLLRSRGC
jgi:membrane protein implicated in regulation of membrane protease activity